MTKKRIIIFGLVVLIFLAVGSYVLAQPAGTEATLLVTDGDVTVIQSQRFLSFNTQQTNLTTGDVVLVRQGDSIALSSAASAVLTMGDGTTADLFPDTVVQVSELFSDETNFRVRLTLLAGKTVNRVQHLLTTGDAYDVQTPSSTASVRGTVFTVDVRSNQETFYSVDEGFVAVRMGEQEVLLESGFELTAVVGQPLTVQPQSATASQSRAMTETAVQSPASSQPVSVDVAQTGDSTTESAANQPEPASTHANQDAVSGAAANRNDMGQTAVPTASATITNPNPDQPAVTATSVPAAGSTAVPPVVPSSAPTAAPVVPPTATRVPPTATPVPPTSIPPTNTPVPPTPVPPTDTPVPPPPTATPEPVKVTLCHKGNTISVDPSSVQEHLDHGDYLGACHD